jgi:hypothetical protein
MLFREVKLTAPCEALTVKSLFGLAQGHLDELEADSIFVGFVRCPGLWFGAMAVMKHDFRFIPRSDCDLQPNVLLGGSVGIGL